MAKENDTCLGLLFTGGEGPLPLQSRKIILEACSLSDTLLYAAADSGLLLAEKASVKPDWIIGDMDSLGTEKSRLDSYPKENIISMSHEKDFTDTELAFSLLREKGCGKIWIIGGGGGRLDQLFGIRSLFERPDPPERWITAADDIYCIEASSINPPDILKAAEPQDFSYISDKHPLFPVSVFPLGSGPWEAESEGLKWSLHGVTWTRDFIAISNEAPDGRFSICAKKGRFLVIVPLFDL